MSDRRQAFRLMFLAPDKTAWRGFDLWATDKREVIRWAEAIARVNPNWPKVRIERLDPREWCFQRKENEDE